MCGKNEEKKNVFRNFGKQQLFLEKMSTLQGRKFIVSVICNLTPLNFFSKFEKNHFKDVIDELII